MLGGKFGELFGAVTGSVIFHVVLVVLLATVFTESESSLDPTAEELEFVPAQLVRDLPTVQQPQQMQQQRERPSFQLDPVQTSSLVSEDFSSNLDLDDLGELDSVAGGDASGLEGAEGMMRVAMQERQFIRNYRALVQKTFESRWRQHPGTRVGTVAYVSVKFAPNGDILGYKLARSSGNQRFDQSVMRAAALVRRITRLRDVPPDLFKKYFATISVRFLKEGK